MNNLNKLITLASLLFCLTLTSLHLRAQDNVVQQEELSSDSTFLLGRWDFDVENRNSTSPSWLEVSHSGYSTLVGRFVGFVGSSRPISRVHFENGQLSFSIPHQWYEEDQDLKVEAQLINKQLKGKLTQSDGKVYNFTAVKAPSLRDRKVSSWGQPIALFDGSNMDQWHGLGDKENQWKVEDGLLRSPHSGVNIATKDKFKDFKLHVEVRYPGHSNSGIYLRGRHEVQIEDSPSGQPSPVGFGAIYGFLPASVTANKPAGEWQVLDITLIGRMVTVVANGKTILYNQEIPGITGGALDSHEGEAGPIYLQGDHGPVDYRNIIITPANN